MCDGLEAWLFSIATDRPLNFVLEDAMWSTAVDGVDLTYPTIALTTTSTGIVL